MTRLLLALLLAAAAAQSPGQLKQAVLDSPLRAVLASHPPSDPAAACYAAAVATLRPDRCVDDLRPAAHSVLAMRLLSCYALETGEAAALPPCAATVAAEAAKKARSGDDATTIDVASCHARLPDRHAAAYGKLWLHTATLCMYYHARAAAEGRDVLVDDLAAAVVRATTTLADVSSGLVALVVDAGAIRVSVAETAAALANLAADQAALGLDQSARADRLARALAAAEAKLGAAVDRAAVGAVAAATAATDAAAAVKAHRVAVDKLFE